MRNHLRSMDRTHVSEQFRQVNQSVLGWDGAANGGERQRTAELKGGRPDVCEAADDKKRAAVGGGRAQSITPLTLLTEGADAW